MSDLTQAQFEAALQSRDIIGQAKGVIMERCTVDADAAFDILVKLSQEMNIPLRVVAQQLIDSLPGSQKRISAA